MEMQKERILVKGKVQYDEHEADISDLMGAFNRREQFLELSSSSVALIDRTEWNDLGGEGSLLKGLPSKKIDWDYYPLSSIKPLCPKQIGQKD